MEFLALVFELLSALALDGNHTVLEGDLNVLLFHHRQFRADHIFRIGFANIGRGCKFHLLAALDIECHFRPAPEGAWHEPVKEQVDIAKWFPIYESHGCLLFSLAPGDLLWMTHIIGRWTLSFDPRIYVRTYSKYA